MRNLFSVCVLLYGDFPELARRCLESISATLDPEFVKDVRVGLNAVSPDVKKVVDMFLQSLPVQWTEISSEENIYKYPMMRELFYSGEVLAPRVMWFDDDSYIRGSSSWWSLVASKSSSATLLGARYRLNSPLRSGQEQAIRKQPWFTGKPIAKSVSFITGGWWVADSAFLAKWDYPFPAIVHNGGDSLLGVLCDQQSRNILHFNEGVAINADYNGRESRAPRRGSQTAWPWEEQANLITAPVVCGRVTVRKKDSNAL